VDDLWLQRWLPQALPLHCTVLGAEGDWVLLMHGLFGSGDNLGTLGKTLAATHRVALVDLRNHGRSPHRAAMDLPLLAADVAALQDRLGIASCALVGHSLGGKVAMELALNAPERVSALVVADIAPVAYAPQHDAIFAALRAIEPAALDSRRAADAQLAQFVPEEPVRQFLLKSLYRDDAGFHWRFNVPALLARSAQLGAAPGGRPYAGPTLFIKGELSRYIEPEYRAAMRAAFPRHRLETIAGAGHWLHGEKPALFNALVQNFLADPQAQSVH
jgi:esterase